MKTYCSILAIFAVLRLAPFAMPLPAADDSGPKPLKVFLLAGDENMLRLFK